MENFDKYRRPNDLYGVLFTQKWKSWRDGQVAGFELAVARKLVDFGYAEWNPYDANAKPDVLQGPGGQSAAAGPVTLPKAPDSRNTATVLAPGGMLSASGARFASDEEEAAALLRRLRELSDAREAREEAEERQRAEEGRLASEGGGDGEFGTKGPDDGDPRSAVEIPTDWETAHHATQKSLAKQLGVDASTKEEAVAAIKAEQERRIAATS